MQTDGAVGTRTDPNDLDLDATVKAVLEPVSTRLGVLRFLRGQRLRRVMQDMIDLDGEGASEAELMAYGLALIDLAKTLTSQHATDDKVLARQQLDADLADDHMRGIIAIEGETPVTLEKFASALEKTAALNVQTARRARVRARQHRQNRTVAAQRLGVTGAA